MRGRVDVEQTGVLIRGGEHFSVGNGIVQNDTKLRMQLFMCIYVCVQTDCSIFENEVGYEDKVQL